ncbi:DUF3100 domain-containing protein [Variovorax sp. UC122_21]|uniref:DUF3100 domain-containing protein n=1 Tax=Variovorax TaxID=34072 RepID=UPI0019342E66|nr:DUF3100 domain-containing protein [Variovorax paradoxus]
MAENLTGFVPLASASNGRLRLYTIALVLVLLAEFIGNISLQLGPARIVLLPLLWALLMGATLGLLQHRMPPALRVTTDMQGLAATILQPALLMFIAKLGLLVGGSIPKLAAAGWALVFQEFGHFFGTMVLGLPIALLLGIKRQAVGATFSVGREPSLAIISEKYGMQSPEGHGVLAEYLTTAVFGAIFMAILAGVLASLKIFDPLALAMGAGVGSGSMMAAAAASIAAQQTPEVAKEVITFAAASNLITTTVGTYFTLFLSLPFTAWLYKVLEPRIGRTTSASVESSDLSGHLHSEHAAPAFGARLFTWIAVAIFALGGNWITYHAAASDPSVLGGMGIVIAVVIVGDMLYRLTRRKVPAVVWVSLVGMTLTYPAFPGAAVVADMTGKINFLALATPILAFAGLSIAKDVPVLRRLGWRIVVTSFAANAGTFLGATVVAQFFMHKPV